MIEIVMSLAFWATPVLYTLESVSGIMYYIMKYNPLYIIKQPISVITYYQTSPTLSLNISLLVLTFLSIFIYYFINTSKLDKNVVYYID
jgi:ABC-type polysaccharide/polyol phosphate export permease